MFKRFRLKPVPAVPFGTKVYAIMWRMKTRREPQIIISPISFEKEDVADWGRTVFPTGKQASDVLFALTGKRIVPEDA